MNPTLVRKFLLPAHERLLRRGTLDVLRDLERTQWLSTDDLLSLQRTKLRELLLHANQNCPFYSDRISAAAIDPATAELTDLERLPTLTKSEIRRHLPAMLESPRRRKLYPYTTGGSTGEPLQFFIDRERQAADQAARARTRRWFGIDLGERELYLWGAAVEFAAQDRFKQLRDRLTNHLLLSAFEMTPARMTGYLDRLDRFDPVHLFGYPSSVALLARHARDLGRSLKTNSLRAVFVTGELMQPQDRDLIAESVGVPVADGYGSREAGFIAHQCPSGRYHITMESLIVELLDESGRPVGGGHAGEVTITHLDARAMPLIRYRTGDIASRSDDPCPCGRGLTTLNMVEGRRTDMLHTTAGGAAHALAVIYPLRERPEISQFKVVQQADLSLDVFTVLRGKLSGGEESELVSSLQRRIGDVAVRIHEVESIPTDASGKHRCVVSHASD